MHTSVLNIQVNHLSEYLFDRVSQVQRCHTQPRTPPPGEPGAWCGHAPRRSRRPPTPCVGWEPRCSSFCPSSAPLSSRRRSSQTSSDPRTGSQWTPAPIRVRPLRRKTGRDTDERRLCGPLRNVISKTNCSVCKFNYAQIHKIYITLRTQMALMHSTAPKQY